MNVCYPLGAFCGPEVHSCALVSVPVFPPRAQRVNATLISPQSVSESLYFIQVATLGYINI